MLKEAESKKSGFSSSPPGRQGENEKTDKGLRFECVRAHVCVRCGLGCSRKILLLTLGLHL